MDTCVACGAELGVGRFCLNCGHRVGAPAPVPAAPTSPPTSPPTSSPATPPMASAAPDAPPSPAPFPIGDERPLPPPWRRKLHDLTHHASGSARATDPATDPPADPPADTGQRAEPSEPATPVAPQVQAADPAAVPGIPTPSGEPTTPTATDAGGPDAGPATGPAASSWDPRVDLLPYEEVDDPRRDDPVRGLAWIGWVAAAVALMGLAFLLMRVFALDDEDVAATEGSAATAPAEPSASEDSAGDDEPAAEPPTGKGKVRDFADRARFDVPGTAPATTDFDGNLVAYAAVQMHDNNPTTTWRTGGDATGETITITLPQKAVISRVGMINGYAKKVAGVNWYPNNRRILAATWEFDDGSSVQQTFAEKPGMQRMKVPPVETSAVRLTLTDVTSPGSGNLGRDYTAISEVTLMGRRAG